MDHVLNKHQQQVLLLRTRKQLYQLVLKHQGCHFRDLQRKSSLALSTLRHHLHYLCKHRLLREVKNKGNNRYFTQAFSIEQRLLLSFLRQTTVRRILMLLVDQKQATHKEFVLFTKVSPATITWHLKKLLSNKIITENKKGKNKYYSLLVEKKGVMYLLLTYQQSFMDKVLDNVASMWAFE